MSFGNQHQDEQVLSEINMTPLVDVMLVLLIIFIMTIPVINHAVKLDLPHASNQANDNKPAHVDVSIDVEGNISWDGTALPASELAARIAQAASLQPQPEIHLRADRKTAYENVAKLMAQAQAGGLSKIGFVTDPKP